jgi:TolB-like protein/tRNA A-37 threonylcarbamoyl transferase component Bud32
MKCPECQYDNPEGSRFCGRCAKPLAPEGVSDVSTETVAKPAESIKRGTVFAGRYEVIEELGEGGMGKVYRVEDKKITEEVALKLIRPEIGADRKTIERFSNELKFARRVAHRNVCRMYDLGEEGDTHYITMEYIPGENLRDMIRMMGRMSAGQAIAVAKQVCEGLAEAHKLGVVHRDLKSGNIMIDKHGKARIMDFGIARSLEAKGITGAGVMIGTPEYMSPEQVDGEDADERSDIYALGVMLYEMLTGRVPFDGGSPLSIAMKHKTVSPPDPREIDSEISEGLSRVVLRCLEKERWRRYQSTEELLEELRKVERGIPTAEREVPARRPTTIRGVVGAFRKRWKVVVAFLAVLVAAVAVFLIFRGRAPVVAGADAAMLVVLPFENLGYPEDEYFADGLTEEITSRLSALHGLGVISRTSAFQYKDSGKSTRQIGEELGVDYVLQGTVRWNRTADGKGRVRVTPQLIRVADDSHIWSEHYDRILEDIFLVQTDIAEKVIRKLDIAVLEPERKALYSRPTENLEAYDLFLQARDLVGQAYNNRDSGIFDEAIDLYDRAIEKAPDFTYAYIDLSVTHSLIYAMGVDRTEERRILARNAVNRAIELEPDLPDAQLALGLYYSRVFPGDDRAFEIYQSVQRARPNIPYTFLGYRLREKGQWEEALESLLNSFRVSPRSSGLAHQIARTYARMRRYGESREWFERALSLVPELYYSKLGLARIPYLSEGDTQEARSLLEKLPPHVLTDRNWIIVGMLDRQYQEVLDRLNSSPYESFDESFFYIPKDLSYTMVYSAMGDSSAMRFHAESALAALDKAIERSPGDARLYAARGLSLAYLGRREEAVRSGIRAINLYPVSKDAFGGPWYVYDLARIYAVGGDQENAIDQLEYLMSIPFGNCLSIPMLQRDPQWDSLRDHPRFIRLLQGSSGP